MLQGSVPQRARSLLHRRRWRRIATRMRRCWHNPTVDDHSCPRTCKPVHHALARHIRRLARAPALLLALLLVSGAVAAANDQLKISVRGLDQEARRNVLAHLGSIDARLADQQPRLHRVVERALRAALRPLGYYEATFTLERGDGVLRIVVQRGQRVLFAAPRIVVDEPAASLAAIRKLVQATPIRAGKPLSHAVFDDFREELLRACRRYGFFDSAYRRSELRIDPAAHSAVADLEIACGRRYRFGEIRVSGSRVNDDLLLALAPFATGEPFDNTLVTRFERALRDTGYFREIALRVDPGEDARVAVTVLAEDVNTTRYEIGAGFSTDSSLRLRFNRDTPRVNARGHALRIESELSDPRQSVEASYRIPHHHPLDDYFELIGGLRGTHVQDTKTVVVTSGLRHVLKVFDDWSLNYGSTLELERFTVGAARQKDAAYLLPGISISRTRVDSGIDPLRGTSWFASLDFSDPALGSPTDFLRLRARGKWLFGLADDNTTILGRVEVGTLFTHDFTAIPASLRFAAGGDNSVRGFDFESLGPRDASGQLTGGSRLAVGSVEISRRVLPRWRLAAFTDAGSAFRGGDEEFHQSVGAGIRWLSPVGQVRVDLAFPVNDSRHSGFRLHVSMGPPL